MSWHSLAARLQAKVVVYPCWGRFNYDIWAEGEVTAGSGREYHFVRARE